MPIEFESYALLRISGDDEQRSIDPVADVSGPWIGRMIFGAPKGIKPVVVHRDYHAPRKAIAKALELAPELDGLISEIDVEIGIGVPLMKDDHEMLLRFTGSIQ